jgi:hypothetical protein
MSFNYHARKVRNSGIPLLHRRSTLSSCIQNLQWLVNQRYRTLCNDFELNFQKPMSETQLLNSLTAIEVFRNRFLKRLQDFDRKRLREKMRGRRQARKKDVLALYDAKEFEKKAGKSSIPSK